MVYQGRRQWTNNEPTSYGQCTVSTGMNDISTLWLRLDDIMNIVEISQLLIKTSLESVSAKHNQILQKMAGK